LVHRAGLADNDVERPDSDWRIIFPEGTGSRLCDVCFTISGSILELIARRSTL